MRAITSLYSCCLLFTTMPEDLVVELRELISAARHQAAVSVNRTLTLLYWKVGDRIRRKVLWNERAGYGQRITGNRERFDSILPILCCSITSLNIVVPE